MQHDVFLHCLCACVCMYVHSVEVTVSPDPANVCGVDPSNLCRSIAVGLADFEDAVPTVTSHLHTHQAHLSTARTLR